MAEIHLATELLQIVILLLQSQAFFLSVLCTIKNNTFLGIISPGVVLLAHTAILVHIKMRQQ